MEELLSSALETWYTNLEQIEKMKESG